MINLFAGPGSNTQISEVTSVINLDRVWSKTLCDDNAEDCIPYKHPPLYRLALRIAQSLLLADFILD